MCTLCLGGSATSYAIRCMQVLVQTVPRACHNDPVIEVSRTAMIDLGVPPDVTSHVRHLVLPLYVGHQQRSSGTEGPPPTTFALPCWTKQTTVHPGAQLASCTASAYLE